MQVFVQKQFVPGKTKKPIDRADCTDCFQQTKGDMVKIAAMAETTGTIYNYWGGECVCDPGYAERKGGERKKDGKIEL